MAAPIKLFIVSGKLVRAYNSRSVVTDKLVLFVEDTGIKFEIHNMEENPTNSDSVPYIYKALGGTTQLGIGPIINEPPTEGTFVVTDTEGLQNTASIAFNASAATVQAAMRAGLTTNYGSCVVTGPAGGPWLVDRVTLTDIEGLAGNGDYLWPESFVSIAQVRAGSAAFSKRQTITLLQKPGAFLETWAALPVAAVAVTSLQTGSATANSVQRVAINTDAIGGTFNLSVGAPINLSAGPIAFNISDAAFATLLSTAFGEGKEVTVTQAATGIWDVEFSGADIAKTAIATMTGAAAGLKVPIGLAGTLNLNQPGIINLLNGAESVTSWIEINNSDPDKRTILQQQITVRGVVLDNAAIGALSLPSFPTLQQVLDLIMGTPSATVEAGTTTLSTGVNEDIAIAFTVTKSSANWHFMGQPYLRNLVDGTVYPVSLAMKAKTTDGATVNISGAPDDVNSVLVWHVVVNA